ncbi:MAG: GNAT family N-acetyltransferase [Steroidobacteraceae bacterium]|jgi:ribosomal protein S18 acetylase RimI-like enzyme
MHALRRAQALDAVALAELAELTFRDTFSAVNTPDNMDLHCSASFAPAIQAREIADPAIVTTVAETGRQLVGFTQLRLLHGSSAVPFSRPAELHRIYVARDWHGKGLAQELMNNVLDESAREGCDGVWLGVWERNPRALAFYRKHGFRAVGEHTFSVGRDLQRDIIMATPGTKPIAR